MVEADKPKAEQEIEPLDEQSIFIADFQKQWEFEGHSKENLIFDLLRPRHELAEHMKSSAESTLKAVQDFKSEIE